MMKKAYTTLIIIYIILLTITPSLAQSGCNGDFTLCWKCSDMGALSSTTYKANLKALLISFPTATQTKYMGYYNMSQGKEPNDQVTVIGLCRGDLQLDPCKTCLNNAATTVLNNCPSKKEAIIWGENCTLKYSNDSNFHLMEKEPFQVLVNSKRYTDVDAETLNGGLKFLLQNLVGNASSNAGKYASGRINITKTKEIYSLVQCIPSMSQNECSDCLNDSSLNILNRCCAGDYGVRILKPSCTLRYENTNFYTDTQATIKPDFWPTVDPSKPSEGKKKIVIVVILNVIAVVVLIIGIWIFLMKMRKNKPIRPKLPESKFCYFYLQINYFSKYMVTIYIYIFLFIQEEIGSVEPSQFDFTAIRAATEDFSDQNKLGQGGFGSVYKGRYNGHDIAVKRLSQTSQQGDLEFKNEVKLVANLQHRNLVRLLGFCLDKMERLLVYEYIPNSSLDKFIFDSNNVDWDMRYKIIEGIARGIIYLHVDSNLRIIHRDLKASNILLDKNMNPKISDFGMARLFGVDQSQDNTNRIVGTYGYMAPEYAFHGHFSIKSDVFSFGVLLLEIVSGQKNNSNQYVGKEGDGDLLTYAWRIWRDGNYSRLIDPIIFECSRTEEIIRCVHIGLLCVQENPAERPTMSSILHMFNTHSEALPEPSKSALFVESSCFGSAVVQLNNSKSDSIEEATNDEDAPLYYS